ncbi:MAG: hypothetical protein M3Z25_11240 [Actinomycetota bacterium]|nr:hypothetical protein [Actinomycetota bacterium]
MQILTLAVQNTVDHDSQLAPRLTTALTGLPPAAAKAAASPQRPPALPAAARDPIVNAYTETVHTCRDGRTA